MRCVACDEALNDVDTSRKSIDTGEYFDLCTPCFSTIREQVRYIENTLPPTEDVIDEEDELVGDSVP